MFSVRFVVLALFMTVMMPTLAWSQEDDASTWSVIRDHIFDGNCASCHQSGTGFARQSGLLLTADHAYTDLLDVVPQNSTAAADGLLRVSSKSGPQGLAESFLWEKVNAPQQNHFYNDHPNYGALMPLGLPPLTNGELNYIGQWIWNGAPEAGVVADVSLLDDTSRYEPPEFQPLDAPDQGIQLHLGPFEVWPAQEFDREFYYFQPLETEEDLYVERYEVSYREGSHHFLLYNYPEGGRTPTPEVYRDVRTLDGQPLNSQSFGLFPFRVFMGSQTPYVSYSLPVGVGMRLPKNLGFDLNVHSVNRSAEPQPGEVYVNLHTVDVEDLDHVAEYRNFGNFDINLPPRQETTITREFGFGRRENILQMWSHAHEHMTEFRVEHVGGERDGELIYWTNDWEHPPVLGFDEPLSFERGDRIRLVTTWYNHTDETIKFGPLSTDEMQFLFYVQYPYSPVAGDVTEDLVLDVKDIDKLSLWIRRNSDSPQFDLNFDGAVDNLDRVKWVERLVGTYFGDSNLDGRYTSEDFVQVFIAGEYEDDIDGNSTWATGDWDGDGDFTSGDIVLSFTAGGYNAGRRGHFAVPEPVAIWLCLCGMLGIVGRGRRKPMHRS